MTISRISIFFILGMEAYLKEVYTILQCVIEICSLFLGCSIIVLIE